MNNFSITFIDPYIKDEQELGFFSDNQIVNEFSKICWYQNIMDCFYDGSSAVPPENYTKRKEGSTIENDYWHFGIKSKYLGEEKVLYVIPNYATDTNFKEKDIRFSIEYGRPKKEKNSKLARFFGASPEKINPQFITYITDITYNEAIEIITAFSNKNSNLLDKKIHTVGTIY